MSDLRSIINICKAIMNTPIYLSGYSITLFNVLCFSFVAGVLLWFLYKIFG